MNSIDKLIRANPKRVFLLDAFGALVTGIFILGILVPLEHYFGMPSEVLYLLSSIAFCLFLYSISCHLFTKSNWKPFLALLISLNLIYVLISVGMLISHYESLTKLGLIYFIIELIIIGMVVVLEFKVIKH